MIFLDTSPSLPPRCSSACSSRRREFSLRSRNEQQINEIFGAIISNAKELLGLNNKLNELQVKMVSAGTSVATGLNFVANQIEKANNRIKTGK